MHWIDDRDSWLWASAQSTWHCCWGTAYWSILAADKNHYRQTALIVLIGLKLIIILGSGRVLFVTRFRASQSLDTAHFFLLSSLYAGYKTPQLTETPSVTYHVYEIWFRMTVQCISQCAASSIPESGIYLSMCDSKPFQQHSALASVCVSCWFAAISVCQLAASRCLRHLVRFCREEINTSLMIRRGSICLIWPQT